MAVDAPESARRRGMCGPHRAHQTRSHARPCQLVQHPHEWRAVTGVGSIAVCLVLRPAGVDRPYGPQRQRQAQREQGKSPQQLHPIHWSGARTIKAAAAHPTSAIESVSTHVTYPRDSPTQSRKPQ